MKQFLLKSGMMILLIGVLATAAVIYCTRLKAPNPHHYMYAQVAKINRLDTMSQPRLVIIGGSNAAFGFDSKRLEDSLRVNVANTALQASVGLKFMVDVAAGHLRAGDLVMIMPEYSQFRNDDTYYGRPEILASAVVYSGRDAWKLLDSKQAVTAISGLPKHCLAVMKARPRNGWTYSSLNFNEQGDEVAHRNVPAPGFSESFRPVNPDVNMSAINDFAAKVRSLREQRCDVMVMWPTTVESNYRANRRLIARIEEELAARGIRFANSPATFVQPDSLGFDTPWHMTAPAIDANTRRLIDLLPSR